MADDPRLHAFPRERLIDVLTTMLRIRAFELKVEALFKAGKIPGFTHLYLGEEAVAAGVCQALQPGDWITSTHRGHGHAIAKGARTDRMMAELFGKRTGYCAGKGGSMHIADFSVGMLGANAIVGGGFAIATGAALSARMRGEPRVALAFAGDGATNRGTFHEALNFAAIFKLPQIVVIENNGWASTTPADYGVAVERIATRAASYGIPGVAVDGGDVLAVHAATAEAAARARRGEGPTLIEVVTDRWRGHYVGDPEQYRDRGAPHVDGLANFVTRMQAAGLLTPAEHTALQVEVAAEIEAAVQFAEASPYPEAAETLSGLFAHDEARDYA